MARILNSPLSAETVTFEYVPSGASTVSTMALSAANFIGGGSGIAYSAGSGISISANTISLESSIYNTVSNLSITNTVTSNSTAVPTASAVYSAMSDIPTISGYIFDATVSGSSVTLSNSKTCQDIVDAFDNGANEVFIRVIQTNGRYDKYRVCMAYNLESYSTYATIYTDPITYSVTDKLNIQCIYFPGLTATGSVLTIKTGAI